MMDKLTCILIDDESKALESLAFELNGFKDRITICEQFRSAPEALAYLNDHPDAVDAVFLDVEMPDVSGLDFLEQCAPYHFHIVFTSAHSQYAINAFEKEAVGYLLKPVCSLELGNVLTKLEKATKENFIEQKLDEALSNLNALRGVPNKIKLTFDGKVVFFNQEEILYAKSDGNYCRVYLQGGNELLLTHKLKDLEELLPPVYFSRIHHYYIINLTKVKAFHKTDNMIELEGNTVLPVSRHKKNEIGSVK